MSDKVKAILAQPYTRVLTPDDNGGFSAKIVEFPGCFAEGKTVEEAYLALEDVASSWLTACIEKGLTIPPPKQKHPTSIDGWNNLNELAVAIANMRYDKVAELLRLIAKDLQKQSEDDKKRGRAKLSLSLTIASKKLAVAADEIVTAWYICKPFMKNEHDTENR